jgi:hypothetical protein
MIFRLKCVRSPSGKEHNYCTKFKEILSYKGTEKSKVKVESFVTSGPRITGHRSPTMQGAASCIGTVEKTLNSRFGHTIAPQYKHEKHLTFENREKILTEKTY